MKIQWLKKVEHEISTKIKIKKSSDQNQIFLENK